MFTLSCAFITSMVVGQAQPSVDARRVALVIGVNETVGYPKLDFAERDARVMSDVLKSAGFETTLLLGSDSSDAKASKTGIEHAINRVLSIIGKKDTFLFCFAGHGAEFDPKGGSENQPYLVPCDGKPGEATSLVSLAFILSAIDERGAGANLLLIDACRDDPDPGRGFVANRLSNIPEGVGILLACRQGQRAQETSKAGNGHGVFFHSVIEALEGVGDADTEIIRWDRVVAHVRESVPKRIAEWFPEIPERERQQPHALGNLSRDPILVNQPPRIRNSLGMELRRIRSGEYVHRKEDKDYRISIPRDYYLSTGVVTRSNFRTFVAETKHETVAEVFFSGEGFDPEQGKIIQHGRFNWRDVGYPRADEHPVTNVVESDTRAFCQWLSKRDGRFFRLPTAAELEYASLSGSTQETAAKRRQRDRAIGGRNGQIGNEPYSKFTRVRSVTAIEANAWGLFFDDDLMEWTRSEETKALKAEVANVDSPNATVEVRIPRRSDLPSHQMGFRVVCEVRDP